MDIFVDLIEKLKEYQQYVSKLDEVKQKLTEENRLLTQQLEAKPLSKNFYENKLNYEEYMDFSKLEYDD